MNWDDFKRNWRLLNPFQKGLVIGEILVSIGFIAFLFWVTFFHAPAKTTPVNPSVTPVEEESTFASNIFHANILEGKFNSGTWSGQFIRSHDGEHCASIDERGQLWIDCRETTTYLGTFVPREYQTYRAMYLGDILYDFPLISGDLTRYDPKVDKTPQLIMPDIHVTSGPTKVSRDKIRFVTIEDSDDTAIYRLMEVNQSGEVTEICTASHIIALRGLADYPEKGNLAEFWLLRSAYTSGEWNGKAKTVGEIAKLMKVNIPGKKPEDIKDAYPINYRAVQLGELDKLDFTDVSKDSLAAVGKVDDVGVCIIIDNIPKYHLHATAPYLTDDIKYRKIEDLMYDGFVEIDVIAERNAWDYDAMPMHESPCVRMSYATTPREIANKPERNYATTAVALPYFGSKSYYDGDEMPTDFLDNLEIMVARNEENSLRAVLIGYATTSDLDDPEANFTVYLSRQDSRFVPIVRNAVCCYMLGDYSVDYLNGNRDAPLFETLDLTVYGREKFAYMEDIFAFTNELTIRPYGKTVETSLDEE